MRKHISAVAIALALSAGSALAADLPSRKEAPVYVPPPPPPPMWTGFYAGLNAGYGWGATSNAGTVSLPLSTAWPRRPTRSIRCGSFPEPA